MTYRTAQLESKDEVIAAVERELRQIGDELHDNLCQTLAGTSMVMETIGRAVAAREPVSPQAITILRGILETAIAQTRTLSHRFSPAKLSGPGLMTALQQLLAETPNGEFICRKPVFMKDPAVALALLRIAQEAVKNAALHSAARSIRVTLSESRGQLTLTIKDNGCGYDLSGQNGKVTGLKIMSRRAESVGGQLRAVSREDSGTSITCKVPV